jgi:peptidoglycan hydrolase-like protein with peptidoglycan-binding domain
MGWLDHSTNNIILDAVLTDYGRQRLATANSAFNISYYALGDDEVDYRLVKKYGRTVGKEKIEKNTPIFEALTNPSIALKYKLIGRENDGTSISTVYLPVLKTTSTPNLEKTKNSSVSVKIDLYYNNVTGAAIPAELIQTIYKIKVSDRFFTLDTPVGGRLTAPDIARNLVNAGDPNRIATYTFTTETSTQTTISFNVKAKNIDNTTLSVYGKRIDSASSTRQINSYITVIGERHGCSIDIPVTYKASLT